jgi:hypothetical protein
MENDSKGWMTWDLFEEMYNTTAMDYHRRSDCPIDISNRKIFASIRHVIKRADKQLKSLQ